MGDWLLLSLGGLALGCALDLLLGDPPCWPHPVRLLGALIAGLERLLRARLPQSPRWEVAGGALLWAVVAATAWGVPALLLALCARVGPWLWVAADAFICYTCLAARCLKEESMRVCRLLERGEVAGARRALSGIVGRDTLALSPAQIARAAVETVAENTCDGVVAPLFYLLLGGAPLGLCYKAVNTMDSMLGYQNARYRYFGRVAAKLDDAANFLPARLSALFMLAACPLLGLNAGRALRVYRRDRNRHESPNSAHTEALCAGALGVELGGEATYAGVPHFKPTLGDAVRPIGPADIRAANRLMLLASLLCLLALGGAQLAVALLLR